MWLTFILNGRLSVLIVKAHDDGVIAQLATLRSYFAQSTALTKHARTQTRRTIRVSCDITSSLTLPLLYGRPNTHYAKWFIATMYFVFASFGWPIDK